MTYLKNLIKLASTFEYKYAEFSDTEMQFGVHSGLRNAKESLSNAVKWLEDKAYSREKSYAPLKNSLNLISRLADLSASNKLGTSGAVGASVLAKINNVITNLNFMLKSTDHLNKRTMKKEDYCPVFDEVTTAVQQLQYVIRTLPKTVTPKAAPPKPAAGVSGSVGSSTPSVFPVKPGESSPFTADSRAIPGVDSAPELHYDYTSGRSL